MIDVETVAHPRQGPLLRRRVEAEVPERVGMQDVRRERTTVDAGSGQLEILQRGCIERLADVGERHSGGERGGHRREDVPAVEGARHGSQALRRLADVNGLGDASEPLRARHEQTVVRSHQQAILAGRSQRHGSPPAGADARIDHGQVDPRREVVERSAQREGAREHVVPRDLVGEVDDPHARAAAHHHPVTDTHELVLATVVGEEADDRRERPSRRHCPAPRTRPRPPASPRPHARPRPRAPRR